MLEIQFDFQGCPRRLAIDQALKALNSTGQDFISASLTKCTFWWGNQADLSKFAGTGVELGQFFPAENLLAYSLSQLFEWDRIFFLGRISAFSPWFDPSRGLFFGRYTVQASLRGYQKRVSVGSRCFITMALWHSGRWYGTENFANYRLFLTSQVTEDSRV